MICKYCGFNNDDSTSYCCRCGSYIKENQNETINSRYEVSNKFNTKLGNSSKIVIAAICIAVIMSVLAFCRIISINKVEKNNDKMDIAAETQDENLEQKQTLRNKYNDMGYINTSGATIDEVADRMGMSLEEFLDAYALPKDMPADTEEAAAFYTMPFYKIAEQHGKDVNALKQEFGLGNDVTEETTWGEAEGKIKVGIYVGEENLEAFKEYYGFGDDVTKDTLWKDIRNQVDRKNKEDQENSEKNGQDSPVGLSG